MLPEDRERLEAFQPPKQSRYELVSSLDGITLLKRNTKNLLDSDDASNPVLRQKAYVGTGLMDLPSHGIFDRGRLVGLWEYDTATESIAWTAFVPKNKELQKAISEAEEYVRTGLGDARSFSLDSPKSRAPRVEALRKGQ
jgi:hypothetical protein